MNKTPGSCGHEMGSPGRPPRSGEAEVAREPQGASRVKVPRSLDGTEARGLGGGLVTPL